jgi:hypothetical protein
MRENVAGCLGSRLAGHEGPEPLFREVSGEQIGSLGLKSDRPSANNGDEEIGHRTGSMLNAAANSPC